jgi:hypothetical protein
MKVLVACEESQAVCIAFREKGHEAYSCDILPCSGGHPEWHIKGDILKVLDGSFQAYGQFWTEAETVEPPIKWDLMIAFPPCTQLALSGSMHFEKKRADGRQLEGINFFMQMVNAPIEKIAIENPMGIMGKIYRPFDQVIQPYFFGDQSRKTTCLWLKNLPKLFHAINTDLFNNKITHVDQGESFYWIDKKTGKEKKQPMWYYKTWTESKTKEERARLRSKTFPGIARAMAEQWG